MKRPLSIGLILVLSISLAYADDTSSELVELFRDKALVIGLVARIVGDSDENSWKMNSEKVTIPGRPVSIRIMGSNVIVQGKFTPYEENGDSVMLVAQSQIWYSTEGSSQVQYFSTVKTLPVKYGEKVYFFPLGVNAEKRPAPRIEVEITIIPYAKLDGSRQSGAETGKETPKSGKVQQPKGETAPAPAK